MKIKMENLFQPIENNKEKSDKKEFIFIIFGGMGDLSKKKLIPALYKLYVLNNFEENFKIILHGKRERKESEWKEELKKYLDLINCNGKCEDFLSKIYYYNEDIDKPENCKILGKIIEQDSEVFSDNWDLIFYLAISPELVNNTLKIIKAINFLPAYTNKKIILEKPFGLNSEGAKNLNKKLKKIFKEEEIYRIDHYLGKETVQNILFFRFGNSIFEPIWSREFIDNVQITITEKIGIESRGKFYDKNGVINDIIQNHMLQLLGVVAMEYPISFNSDSIRDEKCKVFKSIKKYKNDEIKENFVVGQYEKGIIDGKEVKGYLEELDIPKNSKTATYFSGKIYIDNWRWSGVPFYVRAGKRLKEKLTEVRLTLKNPPLNLFGDACNNIFPNEIIFTIQPEEKIEILINMKYPGDKNSPHPIKLNFDYANLKNTLPLTAYERLLLDTFKGDATLFARADEIEAMWKISDPIVEHFKKQNKISLYKSGENGTTDGQDLIKKDNRWWGI